MNDKAAIAKEIVEAWHESAMAHDISSLSAECLNELSAIAAKIAAQSTALTPIDFAYGGEGKIVDPVTGLTLPPEPQLPYRERPHNSDGSRITLFEHLKNEYGPYFDAHLLFSGHLQDIDRPAYEALLYLARKQARHRNMSGDLSHMPAFLLEHGILAGEHLEFPPEHLTRQVELINRSRALSIIPRLRGRKAASIPSREPNGRE